MFVAVLIQHPEDGMRRRIAGLAALSLAVAPLVTTLGALSAAAAPQKKSYIVVMKADPLVRSMSAKSLGTPTRSLATR